ncbi:conserved Plasmodium protein, unknown function [Plasmodium berghei]|uniref:Thioredoxin-like protein, putative n=2 Tax=Plasmodium berghei TaxID=5821 RepID=A0A509ALS7_PLABA|nr:thioredoxin-like protein, putative [Plasmodium berghei ANKA]CXI43337.1 conserved Plasmodium protein, unknown function [Plasmodium berghei]SCM22295.1 conserved Plasmodium protein, unknown function [Plasmodium berghei]SCN25377.1 conserved Plasmodium protein, unknown function [Plasmodium berghei]SCO60347.1 conserved Plasmodium protein, unknown function [Plasmodium berghei]SCO62074.1 conserved Plasmodium protein, unknown function [Plasmodium berghei]|eukprot:XP_034421591.1 thioredoxin-like protein, putative [Plasmodium berghei ANKA]
MISKSEIDKFLLTIEDGTEETALYYLEMCNGNSDSAIKLYYEINGDTSLRNENNQVMNEINYEDQANIEGKLNDVIKNESKEKEKEKRKKENNDNDVEYIREPDKHFSQALINDMDNLNFVHFNDRNKNIKKTKIELGDTIGKLFSLPEFLICPLSLEEVRKKSKIENKYIIVNIQNSEFESLKLNRDIWNNETIQEIIKDSFIFWQRDEHDQDAIIFMNTYKITNLPCICVLCKRTGRKLKIWNAKTFDDPICAQSQLYELIEAVETKPNNNYSSINDKNKNVELKNKLVKTDYEKVNNSLSNNINKTCKTEKDITNCVTYSQPDISQKNTGIVKINTTEQLKEYSTINNELLELHKFRMQRTQRK